MFPIKRTNVHVLVTRQITKGYGKQLICEQEQTTKWLVNTLLLLLSTVCKCDLDL